MPVSQCAKFPALSVLRRNITDLRFRTASGLDFYEQQEEAMNNHREYLLYMKKHPRVGFNEEDELKILVDMEASLRALQNDIQKNKDDLERAKALLYHLEVTVHKN